MEECAEVQKIASKAIQFGLPEQNITKDKTYPSNAQRLVEEIKDLKIMIMLLETEGHIPSTDPSLSEMTTKQNKLAKYHGYSKELGRL